MTRVKIYGRHKQYTFTRTYQHDVFDCDETARSFFDGTKRHKLVSIKAGRFLSFSGDSGVQGSRSSKHVVNEIEGRRAEGGSRVPAAHVDRRRPSVHAKNYCGTRTSGRAVVSRRGLTANVHVYEANDGS